MLHRFRRSAVLRTSLAFALVLLAGALPLRADGGAVKLIGGDIPPIITEIDGRQTGVGLEIIAAMCQVMKRSPQFEFRPWKRAIEDAKTGSNFGIFPVSRTPEREKQFTWLVSVMQSQIVLIARPGIDISNFVQVADKRVGVLRGSPAEPILKRNGLLNVEAGVDEDTNARKLATGRIDIWVATSIVAPVVYRRVGYDPRELRYGAALLDQDLFLAGSPDVSQIEIKQWRGAMEVIRKNGTYQRILDRYK
ncbi:substrate-binding periplasmic protein [Chitinimonas koreensis]|uniref:substrate-binding periplasmic protein n=1 Tax=Chitinimonas koreensis TaxID=356302 RepID=UPI00040B01A8|nr:transporter substrate-binding domain-containing protein [Chitinimonas koreensis]QNM95783.1 transporter substrate-binding domain-containing protein [Chitinimonas koreensis]